jgi:hypothetical protein
MRRFGLLVAEAVGDAFRRRIVGGVAIAGLLAIAMLESCTGCTPSINVDGEVRELVEVRGAFGFATFLILGLWGIALAGVLASDHLRATLDDGSAALSLARPVPRETFALARLAGAMGVTAVAGAVVLGIAGFLLATRSGLSLTPALWAAGACGLGALTVGALAMAASLVLPRAVTVLLVLGSVGVIALANGVAPLAEGAGWLGAIDRLGPPLASTMALALAPWLEGVDIPGDGVRITARLLTWAIASLLALVFAFRRVELGR